MLLTGNTWWTISTLGDQPPIIQCIDNDMVY